MRRPPACHSTRQGRTYWVGAELTGLLDFSGWPKGKGPAAQPRVTDVRSGRFLYASDTRTASSRGWHIAAAKTRSFPNCQDIGLRTLPPDYTPDPDGASWRLRLRTARWDPVPGTGRNQHIR